MYKGGREKKGRAHRVCRKIAHETKREKRRRFQRKKKAGRKEGTGKNPKKKKLSYPENTLLKQNQVVKIRMAKSMNKKKRPQN